MTGILAGFLSFLLQYAAFGTRSFLGMDPFVWSLALSAAGCWAGSMAASRDPRALLASYFAHEELEQIPS